MDLQVISPNAGAADIIGAYDSLVSSVGGASFHTALAGALREVVPLDRLYLFSFSGPKAIKLRFAEYETSQPPTRHEVYVSDYIPVDPILSAIKSAAEPQKLVMLRVSPQDILQVRYRNALRSADIIERVSIVRRAHRSWQCLNMARQSKKGPFALDELTRLTNFARLALPLAARHDELVESTPRPMTVRELEGRFAALHIGLSAREIEVCARAAYGLTVEGTALDLNIGRASVLTYRKRAYHRMAVTSVNELCKLIMS